MKILFVYSGNSKNGITPIVNNQANSLLEKGVEIQFFGIKGKGLLGYISNIFHLKKYLKKNHFDIIHAHYSLSAICATLTFTNIPIVASLMGSDLYLKGIWNSLVKYFNHKVWKKTIIKSKSMDERLQLKNVEVIPNGVDLETFYPKDKKQAKQKLNWNPDKKHILFLANPQRYEKNFALCKKAIEQINDVNIELNVVYDVPHESIVDYLNASDLLILTSFWEGSPNVIKEAMACNCPIVSTDVGDVKWLIGDLDGCYISEPKISGIAMNLIKAIKFSDLQQQTNGRKQLIKLKLNSNSIAVKIINIYNHILNKQEK